jgi:NifB/MoaA-like Fe-S oxidoreductase
VSVRHRRRHAALLRAPAKRDIVRRCERCRRRIKSQAVIVPGRRRRLPRETIETLEGIGENVATLAVVPVGLTRHREGLSTIRAYRDDEMSPVIDLVESYQHRFVEKRKSRFVFASDEWYVGAGREAPL